MINLADKHTRHDLVMGTLILAIAAAIMIAFFDRWPIENTSLALDWIGLWAGIKNGNINFSTGWRYPPWSALFALPLGFLSFRSSWGAVALLTIVVEIIGIPRLPKRWQNLLNIMLVMSAYTTLRVIADGNLEFMILGGALLVLHAFRTEKPIWLAIGFLLVTTKVQAAWLLVLITAVYLLKWSMRKKLIFGAVVAIFVVPTMLIFGKPWLDSVFGIPEAGSIMNSGLDVALSWHGVAHAIRTILWLIFLVLTLYIGLASKRMLTREKISMLIAAGLLLSPYAAANSFYSLLVLSVISLFQQQPRIGLPLLILTNLPFFLPRDFLFNWGALYWTGMFALIWAISAWQVYRVEIHTAVTVNAVSAS
jgi:hypothetical protein